MAVCDNCDQHIQEIRHKCQQCADFDYCSTCVVQAPLIHPIHEFTAMDADGPLAEDEQLHWRSSYQTDCEKDRPLRLTGMDTAMPKLLCRSCQPVTMPLPAVHLAVKHPGIQGKAPPKTISLRWAARVSRLVQAFRMGCAFCTFVLEKFFGGVSINFFLYKPEIPWFMDLGQDKKRAELTAHVMQVLSRLQSDAMLFHVDLVCSNDASSLPNYDTMRISCVESKNDEATMRSVISIPGQAQVELDVFAADGNPAARFIKSRPPNGDPGSDKSLATARGWLHDCRGNHVECRWPQAFNTLSIPKRLLDVSQERDLVLFEPEADARVEYATLSYQWGGPQILSLTNSNYEQRKAGFKTSDLPQTIWDAVRVTRSLGIRYLWVDVMCIIQDNDDDRTSQLTSMGDIYRGALVTIIAANSTSVSSGFLTSTYNPETQVWNPLFPIGFPMIGEESEDLDEYFQKTRSVFGTLWLSSEAPAMAKTFQHPTSHRGWCLQEKLLSPRILEFGRWPAWRCNRVRPKSVGLIMDPNAGHIDGERLITRGLLDARGKDDGPYSDLFGKRQMVRAWHSIVEGYTKRNLGDIIDKLPAIGGVAAEISRRTGLQYSAGLWRDNLLYDMMWYADTREWLVRPEQWCAPTWSWASVTSPVTYYRMTEDATPLARIVGCNASSSFMAAVAEAPTSTAMTTFTIDLHDLDQNSGPHVMVSAPLREVSRADILSFFADQNLAPAPPSSNNLNDWMQQTLQHISEISGKRPSEDEVAASLPDTVFALVMFSRDWKMRYETKVPMTCFSGLLLRAVGGDNDFERIGSFMNEDRDWLKLEDTKWETKTVTIW